MLTARQSQSVQGLRVQLLDLQVDLKLQLSPLAQEM
jgi:hypothetical protein